MNRWSNFDKYSTTSSLTRSNRLRSKSPYRSNSSLSRTSSTSNLKIDDDYFNALNKSLGAHDTSFMEEQDFENDNDNQRYHSLQRPKSKYTIGERKYQYNDNDNDDVVYDRYRYNYNSSNNKYDSEPEYEPSYSYKISTNLTKTKPSSYYNDRNDQFITNDQDYESDESMNEYVNCKSFYPDNLAESKLF